MTALRAILRGRRLHMEYLYALIAVLYIVEWECILLLLGKTLFSEYFLSFIVINRYITCMICVYCRSCDLDEQLDIMRLSGNGNAREFFKKHGVTDAQMMVRITIS